MEETRLGHYPQANRTFHEGDVSRLLSIHEPSSSSAGEEYINSLIGSSWVVELSHLNHLGDLEDCCVLRISPLLRNLRRITQTFRLRPRLVSIGVSKPRDLMSLFAGTTVLSPESLHQTVMFSTNDKPANLSINDQGWEKGWVYLASDFRDTRDFPDQGDM